MKVKFFYYSMYWVVCLSIMGTANATQWDKKFYDPKELEGTVILPMPCNGAMAFRIVKTDTRSPLEDKSVILGSDGGD